jgi:NCAIR mutase (PurE)-related protein
VIAVPTSIGYGVGKGGRTALNAALASCASGLAVVNIDNGFGAAHVALRMLAREGHAPLDVTAIERQAT